jgi:quinol monooxygenase YgiN
VIVIQVSVRAKPDSMERLEQTLRPVVAEARQAAGCIRYDWYRSPDDEREVFVYAEFDSDEAFGQYRKGESASSSYHSSKRGHRSSTSARTCSSRAREDVTIRATSIAQG